MAFLPTAMIVHRDSPWNYARIVMVGGENIQLAGANKIKYCIA
jgi:hypothetical protein